jgi:hypothetical protein
VGYIFMISQQHVGYKYKYKYKYKAKGKQETFSKYSAFSLPGRAGRRLMWQDKNSEISHRFPPKQNAQMAGVSVYTYMYCRTLFLLYQARERVQFVEIRPSDFFASPLEKDSAVLARDVTACENLSGHSENDEKAARQPTIHRGFYTQSKTRINFKFQVPSAMTMNSFARRRSPKCAFAAAALTLSSPLSSTIPCGVADAFQSSASFSKSARSLTYSSQCTNNHSLLTGLLALPASHSFATAAYENSDQYNHRRHNKKLSNQQSYQHYPYQNSSMKTKASRGDNDVQAYENTSAFSRGDKILVEILQFGTLGASVDVVGKGSHNAEMDMIGPSEDVLGCGLILQSEIGYFRAGRNGLDVVIGEVLPAYVENVREDLKLDVSLRPPGSAAKTEELSEKVLRLLQESSDGTLPVGDKSTPQEINRVFPGASKGAFKKAVSALFKQRKVTPGPDSVTLIEP